MHTFQYWISKLNRAASTISANAVDTIVETAKENSLNPAEFLTYFFETLPNINSSDPEEIENLMPWSDTPTYILPIQKS